MTEAAVGFGGNLIEEDPEVRYTEGGIARAMFRVAVSGRREQEASFFTVVVWRDQAEHAVLSPWPRAAASWSWAGSSSGPGRLRTAAPNPSPRSWPRSWASLRVGDGDHDEDDEELHRGAVPG
jgi:Single-strand binding protein family